MSKLAHPKESPKEGKPAKADPQVVDRSIQISRDDLMDVLNRVVPAVPKTAGTYNTYLLFGTLSVGHRKLTIQARGFDLGVRASAKISKQFRWETGVPINRLRDVVNSMPGDMVTLTNIEHETEPQIKVACGMGYVLVNCTSTASLLAWPEDEVLPSAKDAKAIDYDKIADVATKVAYAASHDVFRELLASVHTGDSAFATDGHRASVDARSWTDGMSIPFTAMQAIPKIFEGHDSVRMGAKITNGDVMIRMNVGKEVEAVIHARSTSDDARSGVKDQLDNMILAPRTWGFTGGRSTLVGNLVSMATFGPTVLVEQLDKTTLLFSPIHDGSIDPVNGAKVQFKCNIELEGKDPVRFLVPNSQLVDVLQRIDADVFTVDHRPSGAIGVLHLAAAGGGGADHLVALIADKGEISNLPEGHKNRPQSPEDVTNVPVVEGVEHAVPA